MGTKGEKNFLDIKEVASEWAVLVEAEAGVSSQESNPKVSVRC